MANRAYRNSQEETMRKTIKFFVTAAVMAAVPIIGLTAATAAYAGTGTGCHGTSCSGLDPTVSYDYTNGGECSSGAYTVPGYSGNVLGGYLELRWGPNCQTNWTRFTPGNNDKYEIWVTNIDTGVWAGSGLYNPYIFSNAAHVSHYSDQVWFCS
jgi:hypothetical protein